MLAVVPLDQVGRLPILMANLEDNATTIRLAHAMSTHHNSVTYLGIHDAPHLRTDHPLSIWPVAPALGTEVPDVTGADPKHGAHPAFWMLERLSSVSGLRHWREDASLLKAQIPEPIGRPVSGQRVR